MHIVFIIYTVSNLIKQSINIKFKNIEINCTIFIHNLIQVFDINLNLSYSILLHKAKDWQTGE